MTEYRAGRYQCRFPRSRLLTRMTSGLPVTPSKDSTGVIAQGFRRAYNHAHHGNSKERGCPLERPGHIWRPADARGPSDPLGRVLDRKKIGSFVFVSHHYPKLAERASHSHPWLHLTLVLRGHYSRKLGRRTAHYQAGSLSFLQTNDSHTDSYAPGSKCLHVVIPAEVEERLTRDFGMQGTAGEVPPSLSARFSIALQSEFRRADPESPLIVEALLCDLVSRHLNIIRDRSSARPRWLGALLDYLDDTFEQEWSLQNMAAEMGVHPVYLCRTFPEHFDCTLGEYIRKQRVLRAWQLLAIGDSTLAEIASQSGFADQSQFTRAFKNHFGITPGEYRRLSPPDAPLKHKLLYRPK
jgi:AraC family transcriptional regulator